MDPVRYTDMIPGCYDPVAARQGPARRRRARPACASRPSRASPACTFLKSDDKELADLCVKAYNDWVIDEWCASVPGHVRPDGHRPAVGPGADGRRDPALRRPRRPCDHVPGEPGAARAAVVLDRPLGPGVGGVRRDRHRGVHAHRHQRRGADGVDRLAVHPGHRAGADRVVDDVHRPDHGPHPADVPDDQVHPVRGRHRLGAVRARARRPPVGAAPLLVGHGRHAGRRTCSAATSGCASSTRASASRRGITSASTGSCGSATTRTPTRRGRTRRRRSPSRCPAFPTTRWR